MTPEAQTAYDAWREAEDEWRYTRDESRLTGDHAPEIAARQRMNELREAWENTPIERDADYAARLDETVESFMRRHRFTNDGA